MRVHVCPNERLTQLVTGPVTRTNNDNCLSISLSPFLSLFLPVFPSFPVLCNGHEVQPPNDLTHRYWVMMMGKRQSLTILSVAELLVF